MKILTSLLFLAIICCGCNPCISGKKTIDTGKFTISVPCDWQYVEAQGIDSHVGLIVVDYLDTVYLEFDHSSMGYAAGFTGTPEEYAWSHLGPWILDDPFCKIGTTYTSGNAKSLRNEIMLEKGITDTNEVIVLPFPNYTKDVVFNDSVNPVFDFHVVLTFEDSSVSYGIDVPEYLKNRTVEYDTIGNYYRQIVYPTNSDDGTTGVYIRSLSSPFSFNLGGYGLDSLAQVEALDAFKTIQFY